MFSAKALSMAARSSRVVVARRTGATANKEGARRMMAAGGETPVPQSMKARLWEGHPTQPEGWEPYMYFYYTVSAVAIFWIVNFSPDTTIEAWAQQEAKARLALKEDKGFTDFQFGTHYQDVMADDRAEGWDKFTMKAIKPGDGMDDLDDLDDEDEDDEDEDDDDDDDDDDE